MQLCNPIGYVHSLETFGSVDGPGVRFVVFLQGCALRCKYCHNPETWAEGGEEWTVDKLFQRVWRYRNYWGKKGGITVSGGEPLRQMDFLTEFFTLARAKGVHTALDTAGQPFRPDDPAYLAAFDRLMANTNLVILDLKEIDPERHRQLTGKDNANILAMARHVSDLGVPLWIRHVLVPGLTDDEEGLRRTADFIRSLKTVQRVEVLPYHTLGLFKWQKLGIPYPLPDADFPYVSLEELLQQSDIISLHCPLTEQSRHLINADTIAQMKDGVYLLNTSRGMLVESEALLDALKSGKIAGAGLDVYEEETDFFFEDRSDMVKRDTLLSLLVSMPNVVLTSHQAFLTKEALHNIAQVTLENLDAYFKDGTVLNPVQ